MILHTKRSAQAALLLCVSTALPTVEAAEYIREERPPSSEVHPATGGLDHAFDAAPKRPDSFLGPLDKHLSVNVRSYDYRQKKENGDKNMASVIGGSVSYHTGHWRDVLGFGGTVYTSQKLWGPDSKAGSGLLKPEQQSFTVLGEAYAELKFEDFEVVAFRREMNLPYINKEDIREVPITHESYMIGRRGTGRDFTLGHVTQIKARDDDGFVSMSEAAGAADKDKGVSVAGFQLQLPGEVRFGAMTQHGWDTFNTTYTDLMWDNLRSSGWSNHLGAQFTDQRSVGDELLGNYDAQAWGLRAGLGYEGQSIKIAYTDYSDGGSIARPYGGTPNFNALMIEKADKPGEQALGVHISSHFSRWGLPNWSANLGVVSGWNIVDADSGDSQADEIEYDVTLAYRPKQRWLKGLSARLRYVYIDFDSGVGHRWNTRVIINYRLPGLGS